MEKKNFWERLTGSVRMEEEALEESAHSKESVAEKKQAGTWVEEEPEEAELTVDVFETPTDIVIQTFVAGVKPDDLELSIARDMVTIRGKREEHRKIDEENYFIKELYWGKFSRTITLPAEVEPEEAEAVEKHGLLTVRLQKVDKDKTNNVKVKSI